MYSNSLLVLSMFLYLFYISKQIIFHEVLEFPNKF